MKPLPPKDLWSEIEKLAFSTGRNIVPEGTGFTAVDMAFKIGLSESATRHKIREMLKAGHIEIIGFRGGSAGKKVYGLVQPQTRKLSCGKTS